MRVGFSVDQTTDYNVVRPSIRIRTYDVIHYLREQDIQAEIYKPDQYYDVVVFLKSFHEKHLSIAQKLKNENTKIVYDIGVNYVESVESIVTEAQTKYVLTMLNFADTVSVASPKLVDVYGKYHPNVVLIHDVVAEKRFFDVNKVHREVEPLKILYCGIAAKAKEVLLIEDVLQSLYAKYNTQMLYICEKDPQLNFLPYKFIKYDHRIIPKQLLNGDICIAPRNLCNGYNWGHSMLKAALPMSVGIPVVASPVPSYIDNVSLLCYNNNQWYNTLDMLMCDIELRHKYGYAGRAKIQKDFTMDNAGPLYRRLYESLL